MNNKKSYVYKITCLVTGEFYFGSSFRAKSDWYWGSGRKIKELISKYGKENFVKEIIEQFDDRVEAHKKENQYIKQFINDDKCLNKKLEHHFGLYGEESRAKIGAAHRVENLSEETRAKLSAANIGKTLSEEHRAKIGAAHRGKHLSEETRAKLSAALCGEKNPMYGKRFSEETRAKISAALRGEKSPWYGKHHTEETRAKIGAASAISMLGKNFSEEHRAKIGAAKLGKHWRKNPVTGKREWYE